MIPDLPAVLLILFLSGFVGAVLLELLLRRAVRIGSLTPPRMHMEILIDAPLPDYTARPSDIVVDAATGEPLCVGDEVRRESDCDGCTP